MKRSQVIRELLESYYFQNGKSVDNNIISKAHKIIRFFEKEEAKNK